MTADEKYCTAIELYRTTDLSITEISRRCDVSRNGLAAYIQRCHRELMYARHGIEIKESPSSRIKRNKGQSASTHEKYREAIEACDSEKFIHLNISQIARIYGLNGTALANQLRAHYPDILPRREAERRRLGIADNVHRGPRKFATETYSKAVELLLSSDMTIEEASDLCQVSFSGLRQHLLYYHKDIVTLREQKRLNGRDMPRIGHVAGNGQIRKPSAEKEAYFAEAVRLYKDTSLPMTEIAKRTGIPIAPLRYYMRMWHRRLIFKRRGVDKSESGSDREALSTVKRYSKATAEKYTEAITLLKTTDMSTEAVAKNFGFTPKVFRTYLKEHEPELHESLGMIKLPNGRFVLRRSYSRYADALNAYATTTESLYSIAKRMSIQYNSIGGFIRRNYPELIKSHNNLVVNKT